MDSEALLQYRGTFTVTAGVHRGATFAPSEDLLLIGADTACDICLSDAGLASRHAAIVSQGSRVAVRCIEGQVSVNGQLLAQSGSLVLAAGAEISLGETGVRLHFTTTGDSRTGKAERKLAPDIGPASGAGLGPGRGGRLPRFTAVATLAGVAVLVLALWGQQLQASRLAKTSAEVSAPQAETGSGVNEAELVAQVQDVFRTSGYDADLSYLGEGRVQVENLDADNERVRRAAERVRADVPQLASLTFARPTDSKPPGQAPLFASANASADRMTVIIKGTTSYLASDDGARYFAGSVLPGGLLVRRITDEAVQLDRDGQISWYRF
jgi:hypothetical protein